MLTKKILKAVLNVKHTAAIDNTKILSDGSFAIMVHPTKGEQYRCGICGKKSLSTAKDEEAAFGALTIGTQTRYSSLLMSPV